MCTCVGARSRSPSRIYEMLCSPSCASLLIRRVFMAVAAVAFARVVRSAGEAAARSSDEGGVVVGSAALVGGGAYEEVLGVVVLGAWSGMHVVRYARAGSPQWSVGSQRL